MSVKRLFNMREQFFDTQGNVLNGGKLFFYAAGSSTKQTTYNSSLGTVANSNPMILDAFGRLQAEVWLTTGLFYKEILTTSTDTDPPVSPIWSEDNISGINDATITVDQWIPGPTPTYISSNSFTLVGDQTTIFEKGRRLKVTDAGGSKFVTIDSSVFAALTTITLKESVLASPVSAVSYGILSTTNFSIPNDNITQTVASATTTNLDTSISHSIIISGVTTITALTLGDGQVRFVEFSGALTLTNGASLILPSAANIVTVAGDTALFRGEATGVVRCLAYSRASGKALINTANTQQTRQVLTSGSGTYTTPANAMRVNVRLIGGGGGGSGSGTAGGAGGNGGNTTFSTMTGTAGSGASQIGGGTGGAAAGGDINIAGGKGTSFDSPVNAGGGAGGNGAFGGGGGGGAGTAGSTGGTSGATNSGGGGGGGGSAAGAAGSGAGGGAGGYVEKLFLTPAATYAYGVGAAGTAGAAGTNGDVGGAGGSGIIIVDEWYD